ncbi:MAG: DUF3267 domain-containing protein [Thermogemmatispora sp.]|uniref:DUF3267 domain-containing protein n=1 Tax=Thermogemmatispora sp. TaxID=1968838 RepID=UPI001A055D1C|nr:DUF3267 domain-containing protein [Thermogemmatispora sp.]MBE3564709.1 DUF3267 domain-containing protein [Thermogemmatispora sp.]
MRVIDRFHPQRRYELQAALDAGLALLRGEASLLEPPLLYPLTLLSFLLLLIGLVGFGALAILALVWRPLHGWSVGSADLLHLLIWLGISGVVYLLLLPLHELLHGLAFRFWGGQPYYGVRFPVALYCGARDQLFRRNQYLVVGLAPCLVLSLLLALLMFCWPAVAPYLVLAGAGHLSGCAGDLLAVWLLLRYPSHLCVEDTEAGFRVWEIFPLLPDLDSMIQAD